MDGLGDPSEEEFGEEQVKHREKIAYAVTKEDFGELVEQVSGRPGSSSESRGSTSQGKSSSSKKKGSGSKRGIDIAPTTATYREDGANERRICPEPPHSWEVNRTLVRCEVIGELGHGLTGLVTEREYRGIRVAVKAGFPFHVMKNKEADTYSHVLNEVEMYRLLEDVQGEVVPRFIVGGHDIMFFPGCMVLIVEKVGEKLDKKEG